MVKQDPFSADFPTLGFVPGTSVQTTRLGDLIVTLRVHGVDPECKTGTEKERITAAFLRALSEFGTEYRVTQTLFSDLSSVPDPAIHHPDPTIADNDARRHLLLSSRRLFQKELYFSFLLQAPIIKSFAVAFSAEALVSRFVEKERALAGKLLAKVEAFRQHVADFLPTEILDRAGTKRFLAKFVRFQQYNREHAIAADENLDYWVPNSSPARYPDHVWCDGHFLKAVTLRDAPRVQGEAIQMPDKKTRVLVGSHAAIFSEILKLECPFIASFEWRLRPVATMRRRIVSLQKKHDGNVVPTIARWFAGKNDTRDDLRQNTEAIKDRDELGYALIDQGGENPFGEMSCSLLIYDKAMAFVMDAIPSVFKAFSSSTITEEDAGAYDVWLGMIPGNYSRNLRNLYVPIRGAADMSFLWTEEQGEPDNGFLPGGGSFAVLRTNNHGIYHFAPNVGETVGVLLFGQQGGGKTTMANFFLDHFSRLWLKINGEWVRPKVFVMDLKDSYRENTLRHGGVYRTLTLDNPGESRRNPFSLPYCRESVERILRLIKLMLAGDDGFRTTPEQNELIVREIEDKYIQKIRGGLGYARLGNINLGRGLQERLAPWVNDGQYAAFFDNEVDTTERCDWLTCQYTGFRKHTHILLPLLYWDFEWFDSLVTDPRLARVPKLALCDEVHVLMLMSDLIGPWMLEKINTGRAYNLWNVFIMQWANLLQKHALGEAINSACPVKLFAASESVPPKTHVDVFGMSEAVAEAIQGLRPRSQILRYTAHDAKILNLDLDDVSRAIYANDIDSNARRYEESINA